MRHSFISPTYRDALRLVNAVDAHGWHARVTDSRGHIAVIVHAPLPRRYPIRMKPDRVSRVLRV